MKTVLITGSSTGFGNILAHQLSGQNKYHVIATMRNTSSSNYQAKLALEKLSNVDVMDLDVTNDQGVKDCIAQVIERYDRLDILINNAGQFGGGLLEAHSIPQVHKLFDINVYGPLRMMQAVLPQMRRQKEGLIINISSMLGFFSIPLNSIYCSTKAALESLVTGSYGELIQKGVENILIEPGSFPTELYEKAGVVADLKEITESYEGLYEQMRDFANAKVYNAIKTHKPDPSAVARRVIQLIEMNKGSRPVRNPIDHISGEDFTNKLIGELTELANTQMKSYGF